MALTGAWKEADSRSFTLDDVEPGLFASFVWWLYKGNFPTLEASPEAGTPGYKLDAYFEASLTDIAAEYPAPEDIPSDSSHFWTANTGDRAWLTLFCAYALGDRLQSPKFKNCVIDAITRRTIDSPRVNGDEDIPYCLPIRFAFETTPLGVPLRRLLVEMVTQQGNVSYTAAQFTQAQHPDAIPAIGKVLALRGDDNDGF